MIKLKSSENDLHFFPRNVLHSHSASYVLSYALQLHSELMTKISLELFVVKSPKTVSCMYGAQMLLLKVYLQVKIFRALNTAIK